MKEGPKLIINGCFIFIMAGIMIMNVTDTKTRFKINALLTNISLMKMDDLFRSKAICDYKCANDCLQTNQEESLFKQCLASACNCKYIPDENPSPNKFILVFIGLSLLALFYGLSLKRKELLQLKNSKEEKAFYEGYERLDDY